MLQMPLRLSSRVTKKDSREEGQWGGGSISIFFS